MTPHPYLLLVIITGIFSQKNAETDFDIRLSGGPGPHVGRVEVYYSGSWKAVPGDCNWDYRATIVACRVLGYSTGQTIYSTSRYGNLTEPVWNASVICTGSEVSLAVCSLEECDHTPYYPACVFCYNITDRTDFDIRLSGGPGPHVGRVEVYYSGYWGSVCGSYGWDDRDANVTCRMLGYSTGNYIHSTTSYGHLTYPVWIEGVDCNGTEDSLADCSFGEWGQVSFCKSYPASVSCSNVTGKYWIISV